MLHPDPKIQAALVDNDLKQGKIYAEKKFCALLGCERTWPIDHRKSGLLKMGEHYIMLGGKIRYTGLQIATILAHGITLPK